MRASLTLALATLCCGLLLPELARAQTGYEPDQRGNANEPDELYEPDQRGDVEEEPRAEVEQASPGADVEREYEFTSDEAQVAPVTGTAAAEAAPSEPRFTLSFHVAPTYSAGGSQGQLGATVGAAFGVRLGMLTLGPRFDLTLADGFTFGAGTLDARIRVLEGILSPIVSADAGYGFVASGGATRGGPTLSLGAGLSYRLTPSFELTVEVAGRFAALPDDDLWQLHLFFGGSLSL